MLETRQPPAPVSTDHATVPRARRPGVHRPPRRLLLALPGLLLVLVGAAVWLLVRQPAGPTPLVASGTIEVEEVTLSAQAGGRVAELGVDEGSPVQDGELVGRLADPVLDVQSRQAVVDPSQQQVMQAQLQKLELRAPIAGVIQKRLVHRGEVVAAGAPLLTVADPADLKLTVYVREADLGRVFPNQIVAIQSDAFPEKTFFGRVSAIATRAEFTPRNVQTQRDRQNLVFAITVRVPNTTGALKAGLPVDATFSPEP